MPRLLRIAAALAALLALASCSRAYLVRAAFIDGATGFVSDRAEGGGEPWCLSSFAVVDQSGRTSMRSRDMAATLSRARSAIASTGRRAASMPIRATARS